MTYNELKPFINKCRATHWNDAESTARYYAAFDAYKAEQESAGKTFVNVSNLTTDLWTEFVVPALNDLTAVPAVADELEHCMTVACFNAHQGGKYATIEEAKQMLYQMDVSIKYRPATAENMATIRAAMVAIIEHKEAEMKINDIREELAKTRTRSAWDRGVMIYAAKLLNDIDDAIRLDWEPAEILESPKMLEKALLNGAESWSQYSWGGCSYIYDEDIARTLCTPSELRKTNNGQRRPNSREEWLDVQARALCQAAAAIMNAARKVTAA